MKLRSEYNKELFSNKDITSIKINIGDIYSVILNKYKVPINIDYENLKVILKKDIYGQDVIIDKFVDSLKKYDFIKNKKPLIYRFVGKSGILKTFLVDKIVKNIYNNQNYISIDMKDYSSESSLSKLIGVAPGYVGYMDKCIFDSIKDYPFTIILINNMNNPKTYISKFLLDSFEKGYIVNSHNEIINLSKCIIFITSTVNSNIGFINSNSVSNNTYVFNDMVLNK